MYTHTHTHFWTGGSDKMNDRNSDTFGSFVLEYTSLSACEGRVMNATQEQRGLVHPVYPL